MRILRFASAITIHSVNLEHPVQQFLSALALVLSIVELEKWRKLLRHCIPNCYSELYSDAYTRPATIEKLGALKK